MATLSGWKTQAEQSSKLAEKVQQLEAANANSARDVMIEKLSQEGKLSPALKEWAKTQTIESLAAFGKVAPVSTVASPEVKPPSSDGELTTLSATDAKVCELMGITHEDFIKERKRLAALAAAEKAKNPEAA